MKALVISAVMTISVFAASIGAMAATQYVQNDMNFRNGASTTSTIIGSVPAGAKVSVVNQELKYNFSSGSGSGSGNSSGSDTDWFYII